jgi:hypothetical protein
MKAENCPQGAVLQEMRLHGRKQSKGNIIEEWKKDILDRQRSSSLGICKAMPIWQFI